MRRYVVFVDVVEREWVNYEYLFSSMSNLDPINIVSARAWIALGSDDLVNAYCSTRYCVPRGAVDRFRDALRPGLFSFAEALHDALSSDVYRGSGASRIDEVLDSASRDMDRALSSVELAECRDLDSLGCFIPSGTIDLGRESIDAPAILLNVEKIKELVSEATRLFKLGSYYEK